MLPEIGVVSAKEVVLSTLIGATIALAAVVYIVGIFNVRVGWLLCGLQLPNMGPFDVQSPEPN
jgi:hypothetical protein